MDSIITVFKHLHDPSFWSYIITFLVSPAIIYLFTVFLPREKTVAFGRLIYKFLNVISFQKNPKVLAAMAKTGSLIPTLITQIRSTICDLSFGIWLESEVEHESAETINNELEKYLSQK